MKSVAFVFIFLLTGFAAHTQPGWTWTPLPDMPQRVSNNAVTQATVNGIPYVYSFTGIDSTKTSAGIHLWAYRYNTQSQNWETLADVPDTLGKIAAGASTVKNIIYVMGGYHVFPDFSEISSNRVHRYDPENNVWFSDGAPIPVPIDDQVQAVWRDSLIYLITGWSNTGNVANVQIYNPASDSWIVGSSTPDNNNYKAFGASGTIIGDTIFYYGGASAGIGFPGRKHLRRGYINPDDPSQITWDIPSDGPGSIGYRSGAAAFGNRIFWIGGSGTTYNFDGIAYNGTGGVDPLPRILTYHTKTAGWTEGLGSPVQVMDLRGVAHLAADSYIICGGMETDQSVSKRTFLLEYDTLADGIVSLDPVAFTMGPNPTSGTIRLQTHVPGCLKVVSTLGQLLSSKTFPQPGGHHIHISANGIYFLFFEPHCKKRAMIAKRVVVR